MQPHVHELSNCVGSSGIQIIRSAMLYRVLFVVKIHDENGFAQIRFAKMQPFVVEYLSKGSR